MEAPRKAEDKSTYLFYSPPGVGKTNLGGSASKVPEMSPVVLLDFENGSSALAKKYPDVEVIKLTDWGTAIQVIEALANNRTKYKTVIFDTIGEAQEQILLWSVATFGDSNTFRKWADVAEQLIRSIKALHNSDMNVIAIAHVERSVDEFSKSRMTRPYLLGKKSHVDLPKIFDVIGYLGIAEDDNGNRIRVLQTEPDDDKVAKDRPGDLPDFIPNPTMQVIHDYLVGEVEES